MSSTARPMSNSHSKSSSKSGVPACSSKGCANPHTRVHAVHTHTLQSHAPPRKERYSTGYVNVRVSDFIELAPERCSSVAITPVDRTARPPSLGHGTELTFELPSVKEVMKNGNNTVDTFVREDAARLGRIAAIAAAPIPLMAAAQEGHTLESPLKDKQVKKKGLRNLLRRSSQRRRSLNFHHDFVDDGTEVPWDSSRRASLPVKFDKRCVEFADGTGEGPAARSRRSWHESVPMKGMEKEHEPQIDVGTELDRARKLPASPVSSRSLTSTDEEDEESLLLKQAVQDVEEETLQVDVDKMRDRFEGKIVEDEVYAETESYEAQEGEDAQMYTDESAAVSREPSAEEEDIACAEKEQEEIEQPLVDEEVETEWLYPGVHEPPLQGEHDLPPPPPDYPPPPEDDFSEEELQPEASVDGSTAAASADADADVDADAEASSERASSTGVGRSESFSVDNGDDTAELASNRSGERHSDNIILWPRPERPELLHQPNIVRSPNATDATSTSNVSGSASSSGGSSASSQSHAPRKATSRPHTRSRTAFPPLPPCASASSLTADAPDEDYDDDLLLSSNDGAPSQQQLTKSPSGVFSALSPKTRKLSSKVLRRGKRDSEASSKSSGSGSKSFGRLSGRSGSISGCASGSEDTEYYEDEYSKFLERKISSPLKLRTANYFARMRATDAAEWNRNYRNASGIETAQHCAVSVTTSDEEYAPEQ